MSVTKKGSRRIVVSGRAYLWHVRKKPTYTQSAFGGGMRVAIQAARAESTCVLIVNLGVSRPDSWIRPHHTGLTPATVRTIIEHALTSGLDPLATKSPFEIDYSLRS